MKPRLPDLDPNMWPKVPMRLKDVPLENAKGDRLRHCTKCGGEGEICTATKTHTKVLGAETVETISIKKSQVAHHRKQHWKVAILPCSDCGGAGVCKQDGSAR